jgi:hypothetical protein
VRGTGSPYKTSLLSSSLRRATKSACGEFKDSSDSCGFIFSVAGKIQV